MEKKRLIFLLTFFLLERFTFLLVGCWSLHHRGVQAHNYRHNLHMEPPASCWVEVHYRWDSVWYWYIAQKGYAFDASHPRYQQWKEVPFSSGFFPGMSYFLSLVQAPSMGVFLSWLWGWGCLLLLASYYGDIKPSLLLLCYPPSLFLFMPYGESLLLFGLLLLLWCEKNLGEVALLGSFLMSLAKPTGLGVGVILLILWGLQKKWKILGFAFLGWAGGGMVVLLHQHIAFGNPLAFIQRQALSRGGVSFPWKSFGEFFSSPHYLFGWKGSWVDFLCALAFCVGLYFLFKEKIHSPVAKGAHLFLVLFPLSSSLISFSRLSLPAFGIPALLRKLPSYAFYFCCLFFFLLRLVWMARFASFQWIG